MKKTAILGLVLLMIISIFIAIRSIIFESNDLGLGIASAFIAAASGELALKLWKNNTIN